MAKKYRILDDLTSDVLFEAYGKNPEELFSNAAEGLMSIICKVDRVEPKEIREVELEGEDLEGLLFNWLQELILMVDIEEMFFSKFEIERIEEDGSELKARIYGEPISPDKGETVVKALTYYKFKLEKTEDRYKATISVDI